MSEEKKAVNTEVKQVSKPKKRMSWRRYRRRNRLFFKVCRQNPRPPKVLWGIEIFFSAILELLRFFLTFIKNIFILAVFIALIGGGFFLWKIYPTIQEYQEYAARIVNTVDKSDFSINEASTIYDSNGEVLAIVKEDAEQSYLEYDDIPQYAIDAFVAVEDRTFWSNSGIDVKGILRVLTNFVQSDGDTANGASTITQQLVRNTYLTAEMSQESGSKSEALKKILKGDFSQETFVQAGLDRKIKEILISIQINKQFTKREIMEFYVNNVCYANGIYGLSGAAKAYFGVDDVSKLSLSQIAYLCAIPNRPSYYDPYENPENALERRNKILDDMYDCGFITKAECLAAKAETITLTKAKQVFNNYETTFAVDSAIKYLMKLDGFEFEYVFKDDDSYTEYHEKYNEEYEEMRHKLYTGGYKVYTTLDSEVYANLQSILDEQLSFNDEVDEDTGIYALQGAITCIDNETGKVIAVVGGRSQESDSQTYSLNRAYQSYRQPGSSFKPIAVYTPALQSEYHYTANTTVYNIDVTKAKEKGVDVQSLTGTAMTLRQGVEQSKNGVAWQIFDKITPEYGMSFITNMHFSNICKDDYYDASALGGLTYGVTTVEMASAYSCLANHGEWREPTCLASIIDNDGQEIYTEYNSEQIYKKKAADDMVDILKGVLTSGTASGLSWSRSSDIDAFCKTGTTNNCKDGWLCGATPYYTISVWIGFDQPKTLNNLYGSTYPGRIWKECMLSVTEGLEEAEFERADYSDEENSEVISAESGYYSYLEGRDDSELLSDGYTVADYRNDRVIGESVQQVISSINSLDMSIAGASDQLDELYNKGLNIIDTIYSVNYTNEMTDALNSAYISKQPVTQE